VVEAQIAMTQWTDWETVTLIPKLGVNRVDVIAVSLDLERPSLERLEKLLSTDELSRADRFVYPEHRRRFVACRGVLRSFLGSHLDLDPASINLQTEKHGKPRLADRGYLDIRFNLTHSRELAVFAFALSLEVGIDIEEIRQDRNLEEIAARYFSRRERSELAAVSPGDRVHAFFRCWTRKEAYLKARGDGLSVPLDSFDVTVLPEATPALFAQDSGRWTIRTIVPEAGFVGAAVYEGANPAVRTITYLPA